MKFRYLSLWVACSLLAPLAAADEGGLAAKIPPSQSSTEQIDQLIAELGSDEYLLRESAQTKLLALGAEAFDALQRAEMHPDLEIATRAAYMLQTIQVTWVHESDLPAVRDALAGYGDLSQEERENRIKILLALSGGAGYPAVVRIARYEPAPVLARQAALELLEQLETPHELPTNIKQSINEELGESERPPIQWLRTCLVENLQDAALAQRWLELIDAEIALLREHNEDTALPVVVRLLDVRMKMAATVADEDAVFAALRRKIDLMGELGKTPSWVLLGAMHSILDHQLWIVLDQVEEHYGKWFDENRNLGYLLAVARDRQGRSDLATETAEKAFSLEAEDTEQRYFIGSELSDLGRQDWAEREWRYVITALPLVDRVSLLTRRSLASYCLHDRGEDVAAADLLGEVCDAVESDPKIKRQVQSDQYSRNLVSSFYPYRSFFLSCQAAREGRYDEQRKLLEEAYSREPTDADVLIAMYRWKGDDETYRPKVVERIKNACKRVENNIRNDPENAQWCNHWAWLVANTEGDYEQAVKYSLRSLELNEGDPSCLDTLARCYYANGDLEKALHYQRLAVSKNPQVHAMREQLKLFEQAARQQQEPKP